MRRAASGGPPPTLAAMRRTALLPVLALLLAACGGSPSSVTPAVPLVRGSDLALAAVTFEPPDPRVGEVVTATVQWVDLGGDAPFPVPITIDLMLQPDALGLVCSWETHLALGTVTCDFPGWTEPGNYRWDAWVDTLKVVEEPNEGNNTLSGLITVGE